MSKKNYVVHSPEDIVGIRKAAQHACAILDQVCRAVRPGMSTLALDNIAGEFIRAAGCVSAFKNYRGFPREACISVNDEVVHGIGRADRIIRMGDIVSVDCGVRYNGYVGDNARTVSVGPPTAPAAELMSVTQSSLMAGIEASVSTNTVRDIGAAVEKHVVSAGFSVVREFVGHGCGKELHEPPEVPNYPSSKSNVKLRPGMVLAIEPMVNIGTERVRTGDDGWTVTTRDGSLSAHFEHMVLITETKPEILTWLKSV